MDYRLLGRTGVRVSPLALGCLNFGGPTPTTEAHRIIHAAIDAGVNLIDTADSYHEGRSEQVVGTALARRRDRVVLATKVHFATGPDPNDRGNSRLHILRACDDSLRRLKTDVIDLYQVHRPSPEIPIDETLGALTDLVRAGKVRYIGCSTHPAWMVMEALAASDRYGFARYVSEQPPYNLLDRRIENELIPLAAKYQLAILPWAPLAQGVLAGRYPAGGALPEDSRAARMPDSIYSRRVTDAGIEIGKRFAALAAASGRTPGQHALLWCKDQPHVTAPIVGPRTYEQLADLLPVLDMSMTAEERAACDDLNGPGRMVANFHNTAGWMRGEQGQESGFGIQESGFEGRTGTARSAQGASTEVGVANRITVTTHESWFSRLGKALVGVLVGFVLFLAAFPLLWWNEGRAVHRARSLEEGAAIVEHVDAASVDAGHEGKLIHATALATTSDTLTDPTFGISANALRLSRVVETYQWKESSKSEKRKKLGGGEETTTTYRYEKTWSEGHIDSSSFHSPDGHENPPSLQWESTSVTAGRVTFGAFTLPPDLVSKIDRRQARPAEETDGPQMAQHGFRPVGPGTFYRGKNVSDPQVGDVRVRFEVTLPETVSIVAVQKGESFESYQAKAGSSILLLESGTVSAEQMFESAQTSNTILTWVLRLAGVFAMFIGLVLVLRPISVAGSVVPVIGSVLGAGTGLVAFLVTMVLSLVTIALAWLFYRPLLGGGLLAIAAVGLYLLFRARRKRDLVVPPPIPMA